MKQLTFISVLLASLLALPFASAYGGYGSSGLTFPPTFNSGFEGFGYGYIPAYQSFNLNDNTDRSNRDYAFNGANSNSESFLYNNQQNTFFDSLLSNQRTVTQDFISSFVGDGSLNLNDGFDLTKSRCSRRVVRGSYDGTPFSVRERICDGIAGTLWRDNSLASNYNQQNTNVYANLDNSAASNAYTYQNDLTNNYARDISSNQQQTLSQSDSSTRIGRGVVVVLN